MNDGDEWKLEYIVMNICAHIQHALTQNVNHLLFVGLGPVIAAYFPLAHRRHGAITRI